MSSILFADSDQWIMKMLKSCLGASIYRIITPSDIAYVILLVKNGQEMWGLEIGVAGNREKGDDEPKKKARPLFTSGMGKKRLFGVSLWNKAGLEYRTIPEPDTSARGFEICVLITSSPPPPIQDWQSVRGFGDFLLLLSSPLGSIRPIDCLWGLLSWDPRRRDQ